MISSIILALAAGLFGLGALTYLPPLIGRLWQVRRLRRVFRHKVALTYDDGPDGTLTPALVELLGRHQTTATFFLVGFRAEWHGAVCDQIVTQGHEVACHGYRHKSLWKLWPWQGIADTDRAYRAMAAWLPADAPYRPPRGKLTTWVWLALLRRGRYPIWWTHVVGDTLDVLPNVEETCQRVIASGGGVLLIHCGHKDPQRRAFVLDFTDVMLRTLPQYGFEVCPLFRVLAEAGRKPASTGTSLLSE